MRRRARGIIMIIRLGDEDEVAETSGREGWRNAHKRVSEGNIHWIVQSGFGFWIW